MKTNVTAPQAAAHPPEHAQFVAMLPKIERVARYAFRRESRMARAEEKAASLPAKLTVPMVTFFLPVLFMVLIGPTVIQVIRTFK